MTAGLGFSISASWGPRPESPDALAGRWIKMIKRLQLVDPILADWYNDQSGWVTPFDFDLRTTTERIKSKVAKDDFGEPEPYFGYKNSALNSSNPNYGPHGFAVNMGAGSRFQNCVVLDTDYGQIPDPSVVTYDIFRRALLAIAETFSAVRAEAFPDRLMELWPQQKIDVQLFHPAWISYVAPRLAHLVTPPPHAVVERRRDGGLLMAATTETFDVDNPAHMAVARDIEAALAQFNGASWPLEDQTG